jgi:hypothetical protein
MCIYRVNAHNSELKSREVPPTALAVPQRAVGVRPSRRHKRVTRPLISWTTKSHPFLGGVVSCTY